MANSSIKKKEGSCKEEGCGYFGPLIAQRCADHYWASRRQAKKNKSSQGLKISQKGDDLKKMGVFFANQILQIPNCCEECGKSLASLKAWKPKIIIAHILPKKKTAGGFPSVAMHPENRMFFCWDCHTNYDNLGSEYALKMNSLPIMRERFQRFKKELTQGELNRIPNHLK